MIHAEKIRDSKGAIIEDRETMCKTIIRQAEAKPQLVEIATSALSLVEVCKHPKSKSTKTSDLAAYFEHDYILLVNLDRFSGEKARELMQAGYPGLKPPDAIHIASAIISNAEELHTFDDGVLKLDGLISKSDGSKLKIVKPDTSAPAPLFAAAAAARSDVGPDAAGKDSSPTVAAPVTPKETPAEKSAENVAALVAGKATTDATPITPPSEVPIAKAEAKTPDESKA